MANVDLGGSGTGRKLVRWDAGLEADLELSIHFVDLGTVTVSKASGAAGADTRQVEVAALGMAVETANAYTLTGVSFQFGGKMHRVNSTAQVLTDFATHTGVGTQVGDLTASKLTLDIWPSGAAPDIVNFRGLSAPPMSGPFSPFGSFQVMFRTAVAPLRTGSLNVLGNFLDGVAFNVTADADGIINTPRIKGRVDYNTGVVEMFAVRASSLGTGQEPSDLSYLQIPGLTTAFLDTFKTETLRYNAVAFTYLPLNSELLGVDPVRLPSDGRVPIFAPSYLMVIGRTVQGPAANRSPGNVLNAGVERLSALRLIDANDHVINTGYSVDLDAGTLTITSVAGWAQPVRLEHRIEDMVQCRDAQINGQVSFLPAVSHAYPADGLTYVSSALAFGDLVSRVSLLFDLQTFDATFSDTPGVGAANAEFNDSDYPLELTNSGTVSESWAIVFTSNTTFVVRGQHLGQIGIGSITEDCAPINTSTGVPYFLIPKEGWGSGWAAGNTLRFNTVACGHSMWVLRTVRQGPPAGEDYNFELLPRGGVDNPL